MKRLQSGKNNLDEVIIILATTLAWNEAVYLGARQIAQSWHHYDMTTTIDRLIPFIPGTVSIYFGCYLFWCINYFLCAVQEKQARDRFFCADMLAKGICFCLFLLIPTTNIRPEVTGSTVWDTLMKLLYRIDAADNLFPSIHCLVSWFCWIGVRGRKDIPAVYRHFSLTVAVAVCLSTLTTKQHVLADVLSGVLLAELCYLFSGRTNIRFIYSSVISHLSKLLRSKLMMRMQHNKIHVMEILSFSEITSGKSPLQTNSSFNIP